MTIETIKKRLAEVAADRETAVNKNGDYLRLTINLANSCLMVGYVALNADIDFASITAQITANEAKGETGALYIIDGSTIILGDAFQRLDITEVTIPGSVEKIASGSWTQGAFIKCCKLKAVTICDGVKILGDQTFRDCEALESVVLPPSLRYIGSDVFNGCKSLQSITIPPNVTKIGNSAFEDCTSLQSINIPESVTKIPSRSFMGCNSLQNINIPESVTEIEDSAFRDCTSLQSINIPESVTKIQPRSFMGCNSLQSINIPESVTEIEESAFRDCTSLQSINIPESVTEIEYGVFGGCTSLQSINIPESVTKIGSEAFHSCTALHTANVPANAELGYSVFYNTLLPAPIVHNGILTYVPISTTGKYVVPDEATKIEQSTFKGNGISEIVIPTTVTEIGESAFENCKSLEKADIQGPIEKIPYCAFSGCSSLKSVTLPSSLKRIGTSAFACTGLTSIVIPEKVNDYEYNVFKNCTSLTEVTITNPGTSLLVSSFPNDVFAGCTAITTVNLPKGITWGKIKVKFPDSPWSLTQPVKKSEAAAKKEKAEAMENASYEALAKAAVAPGQAQVVVGKDTIQVKADMGNNSYIVAELSLKNAFGKKIPVMEFNWDVLKTVAAAAEPNTTYWLLPEGTKLTENMVRSAKAFTGETPNVVLLPGITEIGSEAFYGFGGLRSVTIPDSVTSIGNRAIDGTSLDTPVILNGVLVIAPYGAIHGAYTIPEGVTSIQDYAFVGCTTLESVVIPARVALIHDYAFKGCTALRRVEFANPVKGCSMHSATEPEPGMTLIDKSVFRGCESITEVIAPNIASFTGWMIAHM